MLVVNIVGSKVGIEFEGVELVDGVGDKEGITVGLLIEGMLVGDVDDGLVV